MNDNISTLPLAAFCRAGDALAGELPLAGFSRLGAALPTAAPPAGVLKYKLRGECGADGQLFFLVDLAAVLPLECGRCSEIFQLPLKTARRFVVVSEDGGEEAAADAVGEDCEPLEAQELKLADFLEDEILLSIPLAPLHALQDCPAAGYVAA